jgi:hypothetical protein
VGDGDDGALPSLASSQVVESNTEISVVLPADGRPAGFDERFAQHLIVLAEPSASTLAGAFIVPRAEPGPGDEMVGAGEEAEIWQSSSDILSVAEPDAGGRLQLGERITERAQSVIHLLYKETDGLDEVIDVVEDLPQHEALVGSDTSLLEAGEFLALVAQGTACQFGERLWIGFSCHDCVEEDSDGLAGDL